jgi:methyl-accepting chemotaxis protein
MDACNQGAYRWVARSQAILDIERSLATAPLCSALRRLGVTAPLLGVVLTTAALISPEGRERVMGLAQNKGVDEVLPLLAGVLIGAVLAVVNQALVGGLNWYSDRVQQDSITQVTAKQLFRESGDAMESLIADLRTAGSVLGASIESVGALAERARASMEVVTSGAAQAAEHLGQVSARLEAAVASPSKDFQAAADRMRGAAEDCASKLLLASDTVGSYMGRIESRVESSLGLQQRHFDGHAQAAAAMKTASEELAEATGRLAEVRLPPVADDFTKSALAAREMALTIERSGQAATNASNAVEAASKQFALSLSESQQAVASVQKQLLESLAALEGFVRQISNVQQQPSRANDQLAAAVQALVSTTRAMEQLLAETKGQAAGTRGVFSGLFRPVRS